MKRGFTISIVLIVLVLILGIGLYFYPTNQIQETQNNNLPVILEDTENTTFSDLPVKTYNIEIIDFAFNPKEIKIKKGDVVIWENKDTAPHTVTSDLGSELDSATLSKSNTYSHTFNQVGIFNYHCAPHPYMKAKIIVEQN